MSEATQPTTTFEFKLAHADQSTVASYFKSKGLDCDSQRLDELDAALESMRLSEFNSRGVIIKRPFQRRFGGISGDISSIHFLPELDDNPVHKARPNRSRTSEIVSVGIRGLQNYIALADTGIIKPPDGFTNSTNPVMQKVAERVGFEQVKSMPDMVYADYQTVADRVFSPDVIALQERLENRLSRIAAGAGALTVR
jgi:hypothetical protein